MRVNDAVLALQVKPLQEDGGWRREGVAGPAVGMAAPEVRHPTVCPSLVLPTPVLEGDLEALRLQSGLVHRPA